MGRGLQTGFVLIGACIACFVGFKYAASQRQSDDAAITQCVSRLASAGTPTETSRQICRDAVRHTKAN